MVERSLRGVRLLILFLLMAAPAAAQSTVNGTRGLFTERVVIGGSTFGTTSPVQITGLPARATTDKVVGVDGSGNMTSGLIIRADLPAEIAYEDEANTFTQGNLFTNVNTTDTTSTGIGWQFRDPGTDEYFAFNNASDGWTFYATDYNTSTAVHEINFDGIIDAWREIKNSQTYVASGAVYVADSLRVQSNVEVGAGILDYNSTAVTINDALTVSSATEPQFYIMNLAGGTDLSLAVPATTGLVTVDITGTTPGINFLDGYVQSSATAAQFVSYESDAGADEKNWRTLADGGTFSLQTVNDAVSAQNTVFSVTRGGYDPGAVNWGTTLENVNPEKKYYTDLGTIQQKYLRLFAAELWVETLVAQETIATIGGRVLVGPTTVLTKDLAAADTYVCVKYNNLNNGDRVYMEGFEFPSTAKVEFMAVTSAATTDHASCNADVADYYYTVTRSLDASGANDWYAGDAIFNTGTTGSGFIDLYSLRGVKAVNEAGPTIVGNYRYGTGYSDWTARWAIGRLDNLYGYTSTSCAGGTLPCFGVALGEYGDAGDNNLVIDPTNGIRFRDNGNVLGQLTSTTWTLGSTGTEHVNIISTAVQFKDGASIYADLTGTTWTLGLNNGSGTCTNECVAITATAVEIRDGATALTSISGGNAIFGASATENVQITSTAVQIRDGSTVMAELVGGLLILGRDDANDVDRVEIDATSFRMITDVGGVETTVLTLANGGATLTGALSVGTAGYIHSGATNYATGTGYWLDYNTGTPRFYIGNCNGACDADSESALLWSGSGLSLWGASISADALSTRNGGNLTIANGGDIVMGDSLPTISNVTLASDLRLYTTDDLIFWGTDSIEFQITGGPLSAMYLRTGGLNNTELFVTGRTGLTGTDVGSVVYVGHSTGTNNVPGMLLLIQADAGASWIWPDNNGDLIEGNSPPEADGTPAQNDTSTGTNSYIGLQTSSMATKNLLGEWADTERSLDLILNTPVFQFTYKSARYKGEVFTGVVTEYSPWFGMRDGRFLNEINVTGHVVSAIKALYDRIEALEAGQVRP